MAIIKILTINVGEDVQKQEPYFTVGGGVQIISATMEISLEISQIIKYTSIFIIMQRMLLFFHFPSLFQPAIQCGGQKQVFANAGSSPGPGTDFSPYLLL